MHVSGILNSIQVIWELFVMLEKSTFAYTSLDKDKRFTQFLSDSLRLAQWKSRQAKLYPASGKVPAKRYNQSVVVSLDNSDFVTIR